MDIEMEASIQAVIDPALEPPQRSVSPQLAKPVAEGSVVRLTKSGRLSKAKPIVPGSTADFRRREANRLAAERSRSRQHDKVSALETAAKVLKEENVRLREQLSHLEDSEADGGVAEAEVQLATVEVTETPSTKPSHGDVDGTATPADQTQEQQEHSHTILAALTDITGVDFSSEGNDSWMQGMENFLKDSEASGRLGELAAVATGHEDGTAGHAGLVSDEGHDEQSDPTSIPGVIGLATESHDTGHQAGTLAPKRKNHPPAPAASAVVVMAAAINTEMERIIMEDLAETKAAIVALEKQLTQFREGSGNIEEQFSETVARLPSSIFSQSPEDLQSSAQKLQDSISQLEGELPALRDELVKLRDTKAQEQGKIVEVVRELQTLVVDVDDEEKERLRERLNAAGGFVESSMDQARDQAEISSSDLPPGAYSSPAIARRRRGRPPKGSTARAFYQSFLLSRTAKPRIEVTTDPDVKDKGKKRPRKSRSSQQVQANSAPRIQAGSSVPPQVPCSTATHRKKAVPTQAPAVNPASEVNVVVNEADEVDAAATVEAVNRAEAFILSQLASQQAEADADHARDGHIPLDSTSFADFLPAQEELERQAEDKASEQLVERDILVPATQETTTQVVEEEPSVLSRLKQGPAGSCDICGRTETTVWRKLTLGGEDLKVCNACGLYHSKFGVIRPFQLWGDGRSLKKRRSTIRLSTGEDGEGSEVDGGSKAVIASDRPAGGAKKKQKSNKGKAMTHVPSPLVNETADAVEELLSPALEREVQQLHDQQQAQEQAQAQAEAQAQEQEQAQAEVDIEGGLHEEAMREDSPNTAMASVFGVV